MFLWLSDSHLSEAQVLTMRSGENQMPYVNDLYHNLDISRDLDITQLSLTFFTRVLLFLDAFPF